MEFTVVDSLGACARAGADVVSFLQGQLSNDVALWGPASLLAVITTRRAA